MLDLASLFVFPFFILFVRVGAALMVFPGFSDISVNGRTRLTLALVISAAMFPVLQPQLPGLPSALATMVTVVLSEVFLGILLGMASKLFFSALNIAGELIAFSSGFQAATLFDPASGSNTVAPALVLTTIALALLFVTGLHRLMLQTVFESYQVFPVGTWLPMEDVFDAIVQVIQNAFIMGLKLAAPMMAVGFLGYMAFGIFNRIIPQLHAFFVALPITISVGLIAFGLALGGMMVLFTEEMANNLVLFELPSLP
jgi:flagellar biosynthetic protein FliR